MSEKANEDLAALLEQVREVSAALRRGETEQAKDLLRACRLADRAAEKSLPVDASADELRLAVAEALRLALELQVTKRAALSRGGTTRRAIGAYAKRAR